ncbi:hypothetical protein ACFE04_028750 [Oxalis oulophora]
MSDALQDPLLQMETTCGSLLYELQIIWDEVGETDTDRDKMLLELEQECLEVYRRKVDKANRSRAQLRQAIADCEAELAAICSAMGERPVHIRQSDQNAGSLKEELKRILPQVEEMKKRRSERINKFMEIQEQIQKIAEEINEPTEHNHSNVVLDDLTVRKLDDLQRQLHDLQKEKNDRLKQIQDHLITLNSLSLVLGMDFQATVSDVHPSLLSAEGPRNISNETIQILATKVHKLREIKIQRMQKLQDLATSLLELWNLMDTPVEEQQAFQSVTCKIAASEDEITEPNSLSVDFLNNVAAEVCRLEELKASKMKELVLKKRSELEEICRKTHMIPESDSAIEYFIEAIESGAADPAGVLEQIELQIANVKAEAFSRKELLDKVDKWLVACEEECWLEEYNRDDNRYNAGKGAHLTLKRAEKARSLVNKLPGMVEALASKTLAWEKERGIEFLYDGIRLLSMLEEYNILRQEKEQERRRQRDQKKLQGQLIAEQEVLYGAKPSPSKAQSVKKAPRASTGGANNRRLSLGGPAAHATPRANKKIDKMYDRQDSFSSTLSAGKCPSKYGNIQCSEAVLSKATGRRGLDLASLPARKPSFGAASNQDPESPRTRIPFSPISSAVSTKSNMTNVFDVPKPRNGEAMMIQKTEPFSTPLKQQHITTNEAFTTPLKQQQHTAVDKENQTPPKAIFGIPVPSTPSTVSVPMHTAMTPGHPANLTKQVEEEIEYSFEERRAGFVLPRTQVLQAQF